MTTKNTATLLGVFAIYVLMSSLFPTIANAQVTLDNSSYTVLSDISQSCFTGVQQGILNYGIEVHNDTSCLGTFTTVPNYCSRGIRIRNPTASSYPITVQAIPVPDGLPCPAPSYTYNAVSLSFLPAGDIDRAQHNILDLNDCWRWWCVNSTTRIKRECMFELGALAIGCNDINVTVSDPTASCPSATFTSQGDDIYTDIGYDWVNTPANNIDTPFVLKIKGYETIYDRSMDENIEIVIAPQGALDYVTGLETIVGVNMGFLGIIYIFFEIGAIIGALIGLPMLIYKMVSWSWLAITGRPLIWRRNKR